MDKNPRSVAIHDGTFHADEVTACALLLFCKLVDPQKIVRTRNSALVTRCEYVCDVGGIYSPKDKLFDHHQISYTGDLSSAGMVLNYLREEGLLTPEEFVFFNHSLILGVDAHDNGKSPQQLGYCSFSHVIANYNPVSYDASEELLNAAFREALHFALGHLQRLHQRYLYTQHCRDLVKREMELHKTCLFFDHPIPWLESFFSLDGRHHPALFVISPAKEQWKLRGIPPTYEYRMHVRVPLPEAWAGLLGEQLKQVSGISGAVFCHKGRFTSVWETREDAIKALKFVLEMYHIPYEDTF